MKPGRVKACMRVLYWIVDSIEDSVESVSHEMAHAILLFGGVGERTNLAIVARCDAMSTTRANRHEIKTIALQIAGLKALGYRQSIRAAVRLSMEGLASPRRTLLTYAEMERAVRAEKISARNVERFASAVRAIERFVARS